MLTMNQKGAIAETAIVHAAVKLGMVYRPVVEGGRHDMIFVVHDRLLRIQCKWAALHGTSWLSAATRAGERGTAFRAGCTQPPTWI